MPISYGAIFIVAAILLSEIEVRQAQVTPMIDLNTIFPFLCFVSFTHHCDERSYQVKTKQLICPKFNIK
jgi:hypothetical protein